jgi:hypothetical protein
MYAVHNSSGLYIGRGDVVSACCPILSPYSASDSTLDPSTLMKARAESFYISDLSDSTAPPVFVDISASSPVRRNSLSLNINTALNTDPNNLASRRSAVPWSSQPRVSGWSYLCLNEIYITSREARLLCRLDLYIDEHYSTTCVADGLIVSTPSGSTAYNMSSGGPMVAPNVSAISLTPVCPHSLSFRPLVLADSSKIVIVTQGPCTVSVDGRKPQPVEAGTIIEVSTAQMAFPCVTTAGVSTDWMNTITRKLQWNFRTMAAREEIGIFCLFCFSMIIHFKRSVC